MTFMRKWLDMLNMDNWNKTNFKWSSIRNPEEMKKEAISIDLKNVTIYFENGIIKKVVPDVYDYYKAQFYNSDGKLFDTYSVKSINSIPIPDYSLTTPTGTPVYNIEYLLRMRASQERKLGNNDLAYALLYKSTELMKSSKVGHGKKDFLRIVNWLYEDGKLYEAENIKKKLMSELPDVFNTSVRRGNLFDYILRSCKEIGTDYVFCSSHQGTCAECAKYQCRVYCISGRDKRFPKLPDVVKIHGGFHEGCRHSFHPHFIEVNSMIRDCNFKEHDAIKYSNRPFIDDRSEEDRDLCETRIQNRNRRIELERCRKGYFEMKAKFPEITPKSFSAFSRMKNANSKNYQKLKEIAISNDIYI